MFTTKQNGAFTLALALLLGAGGVAVAQIPAGYFTDVTPVLADPQYLDGAPSVTEAGLTMVFTHRGDHPATSPRPGWLGTYDIYMATRTSTDEAFGNVVPGSAPGELAGLTGTVEISVDAEGKHSLVMEYELP